MNKISIVIPVYNENENIFLIYKELKNIFSSTMFDYTYEIIFVDDGSTDSSWQEIVHLSKNDDDVKGVRFALNFGHQIALTAGYDHAYGDIIISMDCDLQHPPKTIIDMVLEWEKGYKVVCAKRVDSQENFFKRFSSLMYTKLFNFVSAKALPSGIADFRLLDRQALQSLLLCRERYRYLRGAVFLLGYPIAIVKYKQPKRLTGKTKYSFVKMMRLAFNGLICFTVFPLRIASYIGFLVLTTGAMFMFFIFTKMILYSKVLSFQVISFLILYLLLGMVFIMVWILGEYIARIYEFNRNIPVYVVTQYAGSKKSN